MWTKGALTKQEHEQSDQKSYDQKAKEKEEQPEAEAKYHPARGRETKAGDFKAW
jgi:hypothetical protein